MEIQAKNIRNIEMPNDIKELIPKEAGWLLSDNDDTELSDKEKMGLVKKTFAKHKVKVIFE